MKKIILILIVVIPFFSCGCNFVEEVNLTGVCIDNDTSAPIKDLKITTGAACDLSKTYYTDENGRFNVKQCFEDDEDGNTYAMSVVPWGVTSVYQPQTLYYTYHKGDSVIDVGTILVLKDK